MYMKLKKSQKQKQSGQRPQPLSSRRKYGLYAAAFICGMCVMILEMVGSRMVAPFLGTSIVVWTALIGVRMASLAAGYYAGGLIADARPSAAVLSFLIAGAAVWVVLLAFAQRAVLGALLSSGIENIYVLAVAAAFIFFAAPGFLLAAVSPFVVRLFCDGDGARHLGGIAGRVSAFSTMGGIA
jgi:predicted membrane-bound spermidine synthase